MTDATGGYPAGKQDAWCGWHGDTRSGKVYSVGQGGHNDYHGNEVNVIDLAQNVPAWSQLVAPTSGANVTSNQDYYADGKPCSIHGYHTAVMIESLNRALRFPGGSRSTIGFPTRSITSFNLETGAYDGAATWSALTYPFFPGAGEAAYAKHPTNENVYAWMSNGYFGRWNMGLPGTWTSLLAPPSTPAAYYTAGACDPSRNHVLWLGGGLSGNVCHRYDITGNTLTRITLTGTDISGSAAGCGLVYVAATDRYYACVPSSGGSSLYVITPNSGTSWACSPVSTTGGGSIPSTSGNSAFAPYTKFLYLPTLGGCAFGPRWGHNVHFLRLH
jgi:hypothetical protein